MSITSPASDTPRGNMSYVFAWMQPCIDRAVEIVDINYFLTSLKPPIIIEA